MKRKLTINTLAMGNLKQRRKQYTILIIGIILAMVFSSGIMFFISCLQSSIEETKHRLYGTQHEIYLNATDIDFENGELTEFVREYSFAHTIGFAYHSEEKKDVGTAVAWLEDKAEESLSRSISICSFDLFPIMQLLVYGHFYLSGRTDELVESLLEGIAAVYVDSRVHVPKHPIDFLELIINLNQCGFVFHCLFL